MSNWWLSSLLGISLCSLLTGCLDTGSSDGSGDSQDPDPVLVDIPIAFVEKPVPMEEDEDNANLMVLAEEDVLDPVAFNPGARLIMKDRASTSAAETVLTDGIFPAGELYDVKDVSVSHNGQKLVFAMRAPEDPNADEDNQPTWNIWEYDTNCPDQPRRVISLDVFAEQGQDVAPHYLSDDLSIVFSSTRQTRSKQILLDENKPQYAALEEGRDTEAFLLHVMRRSEDVSCEPTLDETLQITFNQSHDLHPTLLDSGKILFLRWDQAGNRDNLSLYTINPDGTELARYYGFHSQNTGNNDSEGVFAEPVEMPDNRILVNLKPREAERLGGDMVLIDGETFVELNQPTEPNAGLEGPAQESASVAAVYIDGTPSPHGTFSSVAPLRDGTNRMLVSWDRCRVLTDENGNALGPNLDANNNIIPGELIRIDLNGDPINGAQAIAEEDALINFCTEDLINIPNITQLEPRYGIWVYDFGNQVQLPVKTAVSGMMYTDVVGMEARSLPTTLLSDEDDVLEDLDVGVIHIRSVYDIDGVDNSAAGIATTADPLQTTSAEREARFLRIFKPVSMPSDDVLDFDNDAFGIGGNNQMREILGYVPIEPDGSVKFQVPADVALSIAVLDGQGRRIGNAHQNWLTLRPGEERECTGCHTSNSEIPHGRPGAEPTSINAGANTQGVPFPNTNVNLFANIGETMAEVYTRINGVRVPSVDIVFDDEWTEPSLATPAASFTYTYSDIILPENRPTSEACITTWESRCRITINYIPHIQPIFEVTRQIFDGLGALVEDRTCTTCHSRTDGMGTLQVPGGQLELTGELSNEDNFYLTSYVELITNDTEIELNDDNTMLVERRVPVLDGNGNPVFQVDENGDPILDADGNPIPLTQTVNVPRSISPNGANASPRFFNVFDSGGSHEGYLSGSELKLIAEWLDIGARYYNNPFEAPLDD